MFGVAGSHKPTAPLGGQDAEASRAAASTTMKITRSGHSFVSLVRQPTPHMDLRGQLSNPEAGPKLITCWRVCPGQPPRGMHALQRFTESAGHAFAMPWMSL